MHGERPDPEGLIDAAREAQKTVTIAHVNSVLVQPHWRSHEELIKQQIS